MSTTRQANQGKAKASPAPRGQSHEGGADSTSRPWALIGLAVVHGVAFGTAALSLPWREYGAFAVMTGAVAIGHALTAGMAAMRRPEFRQVWRGTAWVALIWLLLLTWSIATSALYLARIYGALGSGIAVALLIGWCIPILFTIPFASWALASTFGFRAPASVSTRHKRTIAAGCVLVAVSLFGLTWHKLAKAAVLVTEAETTDRKRLAELVAIHFPAPASLPGRSEPPDRLSLEPSNCEGPVTSKHTTLFVQFQRRHDGPASAQSAQYCVQAETVVKALQEAGRLVRAEGSNAPIKLDLVTALAKLESTDALLDGFKLRPGFDGICQANRCLLGWQLAARQLLNEHTPVSAIPELRMGFSAQRVREALGSDGDARLDGLVRILSTSFVYSQTLTKLSRMHREHQPVTRGAIARANRLAERHILRALQEDGRYRYQLEPFSGEVDNAGYNLPRQAGTTLALCEFGSPAVAEHARAALSQMAQLEVRSGEKTILVPEAGARFASLGHQALPLIAFLACRPLVGEQFDPLIGRLARTVLALQKPTGDFHPEWDLKRYEPRAGAPPLFSPGQAVMAFILLESTLLNKHHRAFPDLAEVREAAQRSMHYYGEQYWDFPLGKLFYVEENWHCLAARAALTHHRVDAYERFCIEHAEFKAGFLIGNESPSRDMVGAFALAPLIPPPNTATAGVGEALAAATALKQARGEDTALAQDQLSAILGFLLRQQWDTLTCFACRAPELVVGGYSDSMLTPTMRIDFTQHAWAAIRHGAHQLGLAPPPRAL